MSVLEDVLEEEYARSSHLLGLMEQEIGLLPKGSIRIRNIKGHEYCYLNYRVGDKVKSDYIPAADVDELRAKIERRKALAAAIREQKQSQKQIIRALGRVPNVDRAAEVLPYNNLETLPHSCCMHPLSHPPEVPNAHRPFSPNAAS